VKRDVKNALKAAVVPTLALGFVAAFFPGRVDVAARIYALVLCGLALLVALAALRRAYPSEAPLHAHSGTERPRRQPPTLARLEHIAALGVAGSFDLHHRLRPRLRALAEGMLESRRRISLDGDPETARAMLGAETYDLVRHDRPPPEDRLAPGIPIGELRLVVESLERV
jgi:hypothetical protein